MTEATTSPSAPILVVDDSDSAREALCFLLSTEGYDVESARDGRDAADRLSAGLVPSLILLDLAMPRMDGFEFRAWQMSQEKLAAIPVVVYSGAVEVERVQQTLGVPVLRKPVDIGLVLELVARHATSR